MDNNDINRYRINSYVEDVVEEEVNAALEKARKYQEEEQARAYRRHMIDYTKSIKSQEEQKYKNYIETKYNVNLDDFYLHNQKYHDHMTANNIDHRINDLCCEIHSRKYILDILLKFFDREDLEGLTKEQFADEYNIITFPSCKVVMAINNDIHRAQQSAIQEIFEFLVSSNNTYIDDESNNWVERFNIVYQDICKNPILMRKLGIMNKRDIKINFYEWNQLKDLKDKLIDHSVIEINIIKLFVLAFFILIGCNKSVLEYVFEDCLAFFLFFIIAFILIFYITGLLISNSETSKHRKVLRGILEDLGDEDLERM